MDNSFWKGEVYYSSELKFGWLETGPGGRRRLVNGPSGEPKVGRSRPFHPRLSRSLQGFRRSGIRVATLSCTTRFDGSLMLARNFDVGCFASTEPVPHAITQLPMLRPEELNGSPCLVHTAEI
jgi:hypothetical protein